jgi:hypothetical protein
MNRRHGDAPPHQAGEKEKALKGGNRDEAGASAMIWATQGKLQREIARTLDVMS